MDHRREGGRSVKRILPARQSALIAALVFAACLVSAGLASGLELVGEFSPIKGQVSFITYSEDYVFYSPDTYLHVFRRDLTNTSVYVMGWDPERRGSTMARQYGDEVWLAAYGYHPHYKKSGTLTVLDFSDPDNVQIEYTWYPPGPLTGPDATLLGPYQRRGDIVYMINQTEGFCTVDVSTQGDFQMMDKITFEPIPPWQTVLRPRCVELQGDYALVSDCGGARVIDVSDPYNIEEVGLISSGTNLNFLHKDGNILYITCEAKYGMLFEAFDITDPLNAVKLGQYAQPSWNLGSHAMCTLGHYAFVLESQNWPWEYSTGIMVFDISDWDNLQMVDFYDTSDLGPLFGDLGQNIAIYDNMLYVGVWKRGDPENSKILIFDVSEYAAVPEPAALFLALPALMAAGLMRRRRAAGR